MVYQISVGRKARGLAIYNGHIAQHPHAPGAVPPHSRRPLTADHGRPWAFPSPGTALSPRAVRARVGFRPYGRTIHGKSRRSDGWDQVETVAGPEVPGPVRGGPVSAARLSLPSGLRGSSVSVKTCFGHL